MGRGRPGPSAGWRSSRCFAGSLVALGYSAILHYLILEAGCGPVLLDINACEEAPRMTAGVPAIPLRRAPDGGAAADQHHHRAGRRRADPSGRRRRGAGRRRPGRRRRRDDDLARADRPVLEVDPAPDRRPPAGDRGRARGPLRRLGAGDDRRRARRAGRVVQPDGRGARRARADPRGVRHLPRQGGRRVHPQRGVRRGGRGGRGLGAVLRRARLHRLRRQGRAPRRSSAA